MEEETHPMDREYKKGQRLHIDTRDFSFEGTVCFTDPAHDMLSLANVIYRPSGKQRFSRINVFRVDVKRIIMLDDGGVAKAAAEEKAAKEGEYLVPLIVHVNYLRTIRDKSYSFDLSEQRVEKYLKLLHTAKDYVFIDKINNLFKRSILEDLIDKNIRICDSGSELKGDDVSDDFQSENRLISSENEEIVPQDKDVEAIHRESTVGIYIEGRFRRGTKLSVLCVSTPNDVFVFDLQTLGEEALSNGLRALLESTEVEKIIHDSRFISDCLKHTYEVSLNRVFDTQGGMEKVPRELLLLKE
ncbi:hypothetical protein C0J52_13194 [Blattella germanica]|nr:hypothetical protein C0J52_13194 [Blattella germanica]